MITEFGENYCVHVCDNCGVSVKVDYENFAEFNRTWYESLTKDFCPLCQTGEAIERDKAFRAKALENYQKRLMRTLNNSH